MRKDIDFYFTLNKSDLKQILSPYSIIVRKLSKTILNHILPIHKEGGSAPENKIRFTFHFFEQHNPSIEEFEQAVSLINSFNSIDVIFYKLVEFRSENYDFEMNDVKYERAYYSTADIETLLKLETLVGIR